MRKVYAYRFLAWLICLLPLPLNYWLARQLGWLLAVAPSPRQTAVRCNLSVVHGVPANDPRVLRDTRSVFQHALLNYVDMLRLGHPETGTLVRRIVVPDWRPLLTVLSAGKGAIIVTAHLGNLDTIVQLLAVHGVSTFIPVEPLEPPEFFAYVKHTREQLHGVSTRIRFEPVGPQTFRMMVAHLQANGVVAMVCDRDIQGSGQEVTFFGRRVSLPSAAVLLALRTGAPMLGAFGYRHADGAMSARLTPALIPGRGGRGAIAAGMRQLAALLEREIGRDAGQWVVQQPIFHVGGGRKRQ